MQTDPQTPHWDKRAIVIAIMAALFLALAIWFVRARYIRPHNTPVQMPLVPNAGKK
jgi:hypothetical protein